MDPVVQAKAETVGEHIERAVQSASDCLLTSALAWTTMIRAAEAGAEITVRTQPDGQYAVEVSVTPLLPGDRFLGRDPVATFQNALRHLASQMAKKALADQKRTEGAT